MSGLYLYAVVSSATPEPEARGVHGAPVRARAFGGLAFWCSELDAVPPPSVENVRSHHAVVQAAFRSGDTPLPLRYGQWLPDEASLQAHAAERGDELARLLGRVAGAAEYGVRVALPEEHGVREVPEPAGRVPTGGESTGTAYLRALARRTAGQRRREETGADVLAALRRATGDIVRAERVEPGLGPHGVLAVSHLVARADEEEYRARVRDVRARLHDLRFLVTGPWPPYSFSQ